MTTGIPYKVFVPTDEGRMRCVDRSACLGYGEEELNYLRQIYGLEAGSIINLDTSWYCLVADGTWIEPNYEGDTRVLCGGEPWGPTTVNTLLRMADDAAQYAAWSAHNRTSHRKKKRLGEPTPCSST